MRIAAAVEDTEVVRYLRGVMDLKGLADAERLRDEEQERMLADVRALVEGERLGAEQQQQPPQPSLAERLARLVVDTHSGATLLHLAAAKGYERLFRYFSYVRALMYFIFAFVSFS